MPCNIDRPRVGDTVVFTRDVGGWPEGTRGRVTRDEYRRFYDMSIVGREYTVCVTSLISGREVPIGVDRAEIARAN